MSIIKVIEGDTGCELAVPSSYRSTRCQLPQGRAPCRVPAAPSASLTALPPGGRCSLAAWW
eukprot:1278033-Prymnesium_polylepis.1